MRLTKRQFVEWSAARLAIEISKGLQGGSWPYYVKMRCHMQDREFIEKIKLLLSMRPTFNVFFIEYADKYLPTWMFAEIILSIKGINEYEFAAINQIDNIKILLATGYKSFISFRHVHPVSRLQELKPWLCNKSSYALDVLTLAMLGIDNDQYYNFNDFSSVKKIILSGGVKDIWSPNTVSDFYDVTEFYVRRMLKEGWIISLDVYKRRRTYTNNVLINRIIKWIISCGKSYMLFDAKFKHSVSNKRGYESVDYQFNIDAAVAADIAIYPAQYERWLKAIDLIGLAV